MPRDKELDAVLGRVAPGTAIREGIGRIIAGSRGALIVLGFSDVVDGICSGGFPVDVKLTAQRLSELSKLDGALVLDDEGERILRANVHLVPDPSINTSETGTRHRSAERTAKQTGKPVVSVSESMQLVTLYVGRRSKRLEEVSTLLFRANQALATLERYRARHDEVLATLSIREVEDTVSLREVLTSLQRIEMLQRIAAEIEGHVAELGDEGRLIQLQLDELISDIDSERGLLVQDYLADRRRRLATVVSELDSLTSDEVLDLNSLGVALGYSPSESLDGSVTPRGYRLLSKIPRLPDTVIRRLVKKFQNLQRIMEASLDELDQVEGVGAARARTVQDGLRRLAESSLLERYV